MLLSMCSSNVNHASDIDSSIIRKFCGKHLLVIAVVPQVATLPPGELEGVARGDCRPGWMFLSLDTMGSCLQTIRD